jgi:hypothetical protein
MPNELLSLSGALNVVVALMLVGCKGIGFETYCRISHTDKSSDKSSQLLHDTLHHKVKDQRSNFL